MTSYNMHGLVNRGALAGVVGALAPDVLIVQEALAWGRPGTWFADLGGLFGMRKAVGGLPGCGGMILIGGSVKVLESWTVRYPLEWGHHPRGAVFARCEVDGKRFVAAGSHLSTVADTRLRQARILRDAVFAAGRAVVAGVDVNETSDGPAWRLLTDCLTDVGEACRMGDVPTYSTGRPARRIDALFTGPELGVAAYQVPPVTGQVGAASDHFPVVADLRLD